MDKLLLEKMLEKSLSALIEINGGSIEQALDDMRVENKDLRETVKQWFGWNEE